MQLQILRLHTGCSEFPQIACALYFVPFVAIPCIRHGCLLRVYRLYPVAWASCSDETMPSAWSCRAQSKRVEKHETTMLSVARAFPYVASSTTVPPHEPGWHSVVGDVIVKGNRPSPPLEAARGLPRKEGVILYSRISVALDIPPVRNMSWTTQVSQPPVC